MKQLFKFYWSCIRVITIPIDYIIWNLIFAPEYGYTSYRKCIEDGKKAYVEMFERKE